MCILNKQNSVLSLNYFKGVYTVRYVSAHPKVHMYNKLKVLFYIQTFSRTLHWTNDHPSLNRSCQDLSGYSVYF